MICFGVALFLAALGLTLYPIISNYVNQKYASEIFTSYQEVISQTDNSVLVQEREKAIAYNKTLVPRTESDGSYTQEALQSASEKYDSILNLSGDGIMGYIKIPKINVHLPIYHGTGDSSLSKGVGHLLGSSLPVGGESTHAILSGHSGMASQTMFTDLEQLGIGDVFYLYVLDDILAYQVSEINTVLPSDTSLLGIWEGEDCCTLVTCTPYGINTHRLLVTASRIPYEEAEQIAEQTETTGSTGSHWMQYYLRGLEIGLAVVAGFLLAGVLLYFLWRWLYRRVRHG
ncbi:MAG: class C sortase [Faecousia sp.]